MGSELWRPRLARIQSGPPSVAVLGPLCSCDLILADALLVERLPVTVLRSAADDDADLRGGHFPNVSHADLRVYESPTELLRLLRDFDVVFSFTSTIAFALGKRFLAYPLLRRLGWPPYINISTGSDNMERAVESSFEGFLERFAMRHAFVQSLAPYPEGLRNAVRLRLRNACALPPVHTMPSSAAPASRERPDELVLFHPSHLDWGEADAGPRASTKGNDRFLRALARFIPEAPFPIRLILLDRGPDRHAARRLVEELGVGDRVEWRAAMTRDELFATMAASDVVVDQFDVGGLGLIAWEALQVGRPVLAYVDPQCERLLYDVPSPVLSGHTEDEILARLRELAEPSALAGLERDSRSWASARPTGAFLARYLFYAALATGRAPVDFGWARPFGHPRQGRTGS